LPARRERVREKGCLTVEGWIVRDNDEVIDRVQPKRDGVERLTGGYVNPEIHEQWSVVSEQWPVAGGQWSVSSGRWSVFWMEQSVLRYSDSSSPTTDH